MVKKSLLTAFIFHIHSPGAIKFTTLSVDAYATFFRSVDKLIASRITFQKPKELSLSKDVMSLAKEFIRVLSCSKKTKCHTLLLEMLDREADVDIYDDICEALELALRKKETIQPWCIGIAVSNHDIFPESLLLTRRLIPICKENNIGLILLSDDQKVKPSILCQGKLPIMRELPMFQPSEKEIGPKEEIERRLSSEQIAMAFQVLFGHFEIKINGTAFHVPAVASVKKLAKDTIFVKQLRDDVSRILGNTTFLIIPFGIPLGGMNELSLALAEGDTERLCDPAKIKGYNGRPILFLCDFLSRMYPIEDKISELRTRGNKQIAVAAVARYQDSPKFNEIQELFYLGTGYKAVLASNSSCRFCNQDVPVIVGEHFEDFARKIKQFDSFTFWEFISQSEGFFNVGHWPSNRTPNHYHFRILTDPIFKQHCYGLSLRLRNLLESKSILPEWVQKIVCTEGEESTALSMGLSEVLGLHQKDVVRIPRRFFASIAGKQLDPALLKYIDSTYGDETLRRQNVLIVDQAAHHFKTLSALRDICGYYNCAVLAFTVFIDRTDTALSLGEYLHDSHYIALYSWSVPPRRAHECPCMEEQL